MQTMNTDQQPHYPNSPGPYQAPTGYYVTNGLDSHYTMRNPNMYAQQMHMSQQFYNPAAIMVQQNFQTNPQFYSTGAPRAMAQQHIPIIRPPNESSVGPQTFIASGQYQPYPQHPNMYATQQYPSFQAQQIYSPTSIQTTNQPQPQYPTNNSQLQTQSSQTSQQSLHDQQHGPSSQSSETTNKRQKKPLAIVDPTSHQEIVVNPTASTNVTTATVEDSTTDSTVQNSKSTDDASKSQKRAEFRQQFALLLNPNAQTEKEANQSSTKESQIDDNLQPSTHSSRSSSISKASSEQSHSVVPTESITEDKPIQGENVPEEPELSDSKPTPEDSPNELINENSPSEPIENVTPAPVNDTESESGTLGKTSSGSKRHGYTKEELRRKQLSLLSQERPLTLVEIPGVTSPAVPPQPSKPKVDPYEQFIRDVTAILNKLTPQNNEKLVQKLDKLELNSAERLEGMISVMFIKAVEAAIFCSLYAELCKHFERQQVTVPDATGQPVTYYFRQILLSRCQKEFECDYRQNIKYEERLKEVEAIVDEKTRKDAAEQLEEDLLKAKRKKLGNIIFIGELFKLQMLTDTIMYDCIKYLLRDKSDEESLECLCKLLTNMGKELESKANEKPDNRKLLEKNYVELENISSQRQTSARIRFMIQDLLDLRKAHWVARRAEMKPTTIDEIHETERLKREQQEFDRERERLQRRDQNRSGGGGGGPRQYTESRGSRGSGVKQQSNRADEDRNDNRVIVNSLRQYQSSEKQNQGGLSLNFAPPRAWGKGSGVEKKSEDDRSNAGKTNKPPAGLTTSLRSKTGGSPGASAYGVQRQPSRELARDNSLRDRENAKESLRKTTSASGPSNPNNTNSREQSRNISPDSNKTSPTEKTANTPFNEEKTQASVHSLIEEYTGNYADNNDRPVNEAIEDLSSFCTANLNQQAVVVRELFTNVLEAKPRARKAVGHLLDVALQKNIFSTEGFLSGIKMFIEVVPDYAVDIPLIWQYIAEILGALFGASSSNMNLLKPILQSIPETKSKQLFQDIIRYAVEFSSKTQVQKFWQSAGFSSDDLLKIDPSFINEYNWLTDPVESEAAAAATTTTTITTTTDNPTPDADPRLVTLFKSINDKGTTVTDDQILSYIHENMNSTDKYYIRNIVLSYLEACLINRDSQKKIQEDIAKKRMKVLNAIIENRLEAEVQAVYAIQNFVNKLEHPSKMARLLFDIFYDEECVSEEAFFEWLNHPDQSETEGHSGVVMSTKDFFTWLQADTEHEEGDGEENES